MQNALVLSFYKYSVFCHMLINYHLEGLPVPEVVRLSSPKEMLVHIVGVW